MKKVKKGSSLVLVIFIMSIVFIAGTGLLSLSYHSYQYRKVEENKKVNFYSAESGLDKAYVIIQNYIVQAIEEGNTAVINLNVNKDSVFQNTYNKYIDDNLTNLENEINSIENEDYIILVENISNSMKDNGEVILQLKSSSKNPSFNRIVTADFVIKEASIGSSNIITMPKNVIWSKAISVEGNLYVKNGNVEIANGDVFVNGNKTGSSNIDNYFYSKSGNGVIIQGNGSTLSVKNGSLATNKDLNLYETNNNFIVNGNVYGKNMLVDKDSNNININLNLDQNKVSSGSLYLLDDLEMNGKAMKVNINGGYFGLSDGSQAKNNDPNSSSSININTTDLGNGSKLSIGKDVIIAGVSYIDVKGPDGTTKFKTGESISIKGNYRAYTTPIAQVSQSHIFEYFDPLVLVNKKKGDLENQMVDLTVEEKAQYLKQYELLKNLKLGNGIEIKSNDGNYDRIYTGIGFEDNVALPNRVSNIKSEKLILDNRVKLKDQIYYMGVAEDYGITNLDNYLNNAVSVNTNIDFSKLPSSNIIKGNELFVYNKNNTSLHLKGKNSSSSPLVTNLVDLKDTTSCKGLIISKGDIFISGNFDFTGTIICGGNIYFEDSNTKKITYDNTFLNTTMLNNYNIMKDVFINYNPNNDGKYLKATLFEDGEMTNIESLIQRRNWNIIK